MNSVGTAWRGDPWAKLEEYAPIPDTVVDRNGACVVLGPLVWRLNDPGKDLLIRWSRFPMSSPLVVYAVRLYFSHLIQSLAPMTVYNAFSDLVEAGRKYGRSLVSAKPDIVEHEIRELVLRQIESQRKKNSLQPLHHLRAWYLWCADQGLPGFSAEFAIVLEDMVLGGDEKGVAVKTHDPLKGALKPLEVSALRSAMRAHEGNSKVFEGIALIWLHLALGCNVRNIALLRAEDLLVHNHPNSVDGSENSSYVLRVPRIKKRATRPRQEFRDRALNPEIGRLLERLINSNRETHTIENGCAFPMFVSTALRTTMTSQNYEWARHKTSGSLALLMRDTIKKLNVISPVTGQLLVLNPRRLRRTFATNMVHQGCPPRVLADLLDHSDLQHVTVYYESTGEFVDRLNSAVATQLGAKVGMFLGVVSDLPPFGIEPERRVYGLAVEASRISTLGRCGSDGVCALAPPLACYTCSKFKALKDADHRSLLQNVIEMRDRRRAKAADHKDRVSAQLDDTILAIGDVVAKIEALK